MKKRAYLLLLLLFMILFSSSCQHAATTMQVVYPALTWPDSGLASLLPCPESTNGSVEFSEEREFLAYVGQTDRDAFLRYVQSCWDNGFSSRYHRGEDYFYADSGDGHHLAITLEEGDVMRILLDGPALQAVDAEADVDTDASEVTARILTDASVSSEEEDYVLNTHTMRFHRPDCSSVQDMKESNRMDYHGTREALLEEGYEPCSRCNP